MTRSGLVVRLTRCEGVRWFPALFAAALASQGCPWYPEYVVYEQHFPYERGQFIYEARVLSPSGDSVLHQAVGVGLTEEQAVQEVTFNGLSVYRRNCDYLANAS